MEEQKENTKEEKGNRKLYGCVFAIIFIITAAVCIFLIVRAIDKRSGNTDRTLTSRPARYSDIQIRTSGELSLSAIFIVTPNVDIDNLQITMRFYKANNQFITSKVKTIGNVKEGEEYSIKFGVTDFTLSQLWDMAQWNYEVTGGNVSYFS